MTTKILKVGLIGFGLSGKTFHYPLVTTHVGFKLSMVYSSKRETAEELQESNPDCIITQDIDDVFNSEVDIVVITSPNKLHYEHAVRALEAGKHIVVEKPFTLDSEQAIQLLELSEKKNLICSVFHNRRWDGDFKTVEKIIHNQSLGNLREYEAHFDRFRNYQKPGAWKEKKAEPGAGILYDLGPHLIDQALYLFGMPQSIYADIRTQRIGLEVDDNFELLLYYPNLKVTLKAGMLVKEVLPKFILLGDQGSFVKYGMDIQESQSKSGLLPNDKIWGIEDPSYWGVINTLGQDGADKRQTIKTEVGDYISFYDQLLEAAADRPTKLPSALDGYNVMRIIELAKESSHTGHKLSLNLS